MTNFFFGVDSALLRSRNSEINQKSFLRDLTKRKKIDPKGSVNVLSTSERTSLTRQMTTLPKGTKFRNIGHELATVDPSDNYKIKPDGNLAQLGLKFNLGKIETGKFPTSVCGGKRPVTFHRFQIKNPNSNSKQWENTIGISDAIMLIGDSPIHGHTHTEERYTALVPTDKNGKPVSYDNNKPIALMYLEDPKTREYEIHPIYVGDTLILKPGIIHGSTALQGTRTKFHLQFSPGLVMRPDNNLSGKENSQRRRNRDEKIVYPSTLARIKQVIA